MNRLMLVFRSDGSVYFRTASVSPARELDEENFWRALGYRVEFEEVKS